ncbi:MAG TPA: hypothetical protein VN449_04420 [Gaiellaceae bacterium]|nr:hypothetical protein [Gaiellaceae bacterium]
MTSWPYLLIFAVVVALWTAAAISYWLERRAWKREAELWAEMFGGDTYSRKAPE